MDRVRDTIGFGRFRIGGVGVAEVALSAFGPDRPGRGGREVTQQLRFLQQGPVAKVGFRQFPAQAAEVANPHNGLAADGAAHGLDDAPVRGREIEQKTLAVLAQCIDGMIHLQRRLRRQPGSEGEDALRGILLRFLRHHERNIARDLRAVVAGRPRDQDLGFRKQQCAEPIGLGLQVRDIGAQPRLVSRCAEPRAHQEDRRHHRKAEQRQCGGQRREFLAVQIQMHRDRIHERQIAGTSGRDRSQGSAKTDQAVTCQ